MTAVERYAKAVVAFLGTTTTIILATVPPHTALWNWATVVAGVLTVLGVGGVPNQYGVAALRAKLAEAEREQQPAEPLSVMDEQVERLRERGVPLSATAGGSANPPTPTVGTNWTAGVGGSSTVKVCTGGADCPIPGHAGAVHPHDGRPPRQTW